MKRSNAIACVGVIFALALFTPVMGQSEWYGVNCGSPSSMYYTSPQGDIYLPDAPYSGTSGYGYLGTASHALGPNRTIYGSEDMDSLYFFRREGIFSYLFNVNNGSYAVSLYIEEKTYHWKYFRWFSILAEGDTVAQNIDIYALVGREYAIPLRFLVECNDGYLNVDFVSDTCEATVSAISVRRIWPDSIAPAPIQGFNVINGYCMNILYWDYVVANDLAGYRIYRRQPGQEWQLLSLETHPLYRYFDYAAEVGIEYEYAVSSVDLWGNESPLSDSLSAASLPFEDTELTRYLMEVTEANLYLLNVNIYSNDYVDADLTLEGEYFPGSGIRYRGGSSRELYKKSYKLKLAAGEAHDNRDRFNLNAEQRYPSMLTARLGYQTYDLLGLPNPTTQEVHLDQNTEYIGVYLDIENVDNHFLERIGWSPSGNLYEAFSDLQLLPTYEDYQNDYVKVNNEESDWYDIIGFVEWLDGTSPAQFHLEAGDRCDLDSYIDIYVCRIATADQDFAWHNYYMYVNPANAKWHFVAWDHDMTFDTYYAESPIDLGSEAHPIPDETGMGRWDRLLNRVLEDDLYRYSYCKKLERFLNNGFSTQACIERIDSAYQEIYEDAIRDVYKQGKERPDLFENSTVSLNSFATLRVPFLLGEIESFITDPILTPYFRLNEIQSSNSTTMADEAGDYDPWIEIVNLAPVELDMENFVLHYGQDSWTLPAESVVDDYGFLLIWLDGETGEGPLHASFTLSPGGGNLWLEERHGGLADSVTFPALSSDQVWAREVDGSGNWSGNLIPTPAATNTPLADPGPLVINEFMALNNSTIQDPAGDYDDWIEIYNPSLDAIPLAGLYLTDDLTRPTRWAFPDTSIAPGEFLLVWCDDEVVEGVMHTVFKLSGDGEQVGLFDRDGETPIDTLTFGPQATDISYGRWPDGSDDWFFCNPSPGEGNVGVPGESATPSLPQFFALEPNFPNPFNPVTEIRFALPRPSPVRLAIYNLCGQEVIRLIDEEMQAGHQRVLFDASSLSSGIYFCQLQGGEFVAARKMVLIK